MTKQAAGEAPLLTVHTLAYNQAPYIRKCLEGIVLQRTNFKFEAIVHDDASTDGTADIIREYAERYPDIIRPIIETENQFSKPGAPIVGIMRREMRGKYVAYCEGDDYWTDPLKLQKQVDILESRPEVTMVYTSFDVVGFDDKPLSHWVYDYERRVSRSGDILPLLLHTQYLQTVTVCIRRDIVYGGIALGSPNEVDYARYLAAAVQGPCVYLPEATCSYRSHAGGATFSGVMPLARLFAEARLYYCRQLFEGNVAYKRSWWMMTRVRFAFVVSALKKRRPFKKEYFQLIRSHTSLWTLVPAALVYKPLFTLYRLVLRAFGRKIR